MNSPLLSFDFYFLFPELKLGLSFEILQLEGIPMTLALYIFDAKMWHLLVFYQALVSAYA